MKKTVKTTAACVLAGALSLGVAASAANSPEEHTARLSPEYTIQIDGTSRVFYNAAGEEVHPLACDGSIYLPVRAIGELMGKNVDWNESTKTVTISGVRTTGAVNGTPDWDAKAESIIVSVRPDFNIVVEGITKTFYDANGEIVYPLLYQGSTYLPIRSVGQMMGKDVSWDGNTQTVSITGGNLVTDADSFGGNGTPNGNPNPNPTPNPNPNPNPGGTPNNNQTPNNGGIGLEKAKEIALQHAGLAANQVTFSKGKLDWEDGVQVYEIEFYTTNKEYDYEINAATGKILSYDYDAESYVPPVTNNNEITAAKAKEIALKQVSGATTANIRSCKLDWDDGRATYEVDLVYNEMEYEFEIDASNGRILSQDVESVYD